MSRRIPFRQQMEITDCGAACLAMVLEHFGRWVDIETLRQTSGTGRSGVSALGIANAARGFGLQVTGVKLDLDELHALPRGTILHWEFRHFVVFEEHKFGQVTIVDPALGRRRLTMKQMDSAFTGVALLLEPSKAFKKEAASRGYAPYFRALWSERRSWFGIFGAAAFLITLGLIGPFLVRGLIDAAIPGRDRNLVRLTAIALSLAAIFYFAASVVRANLLIYLRAKVDLNITKRFVHHLVKLPYAFFQRRTMGDLMVRVRSNAELRETLTASALSVVIDGTLALTYIALLAAIDSELMVVTGSLAVLHIVFVLLARRPYQFRAAEVLEARSSEEASLAQLLSGIETLKCAAAEERFLERWSRMMTREVRLEAAKSRLVASLDAAIDTTRFATPTALVAVAVLRVSAGTATLGTMLSAAALAGAFLSPFSGLAATLLRLQLLRVYQERLDDVLRRTTEDAQGNGVRRRAERLRGGISLDQVSFRYNDTDPLVLDELSAEIKQGRLVGIVGGSGCGKSTLTSLLVGLYRPTGGRIFFDEEDLTELDLSTVRRQIGFVPQRPSFFLGSIRENICLGDFAIPIERIDEALRIAQIKSEVESFPLGLDTILGDGGTSLSGGQRQRLAIARALAHSPRLLILDEATSSVDIATEQLIFGELINIPITKIVVTHRLTSIKLADDILVLSGGKVIEKGRASSLLRKRGEFSRLYGK